jgi:hypothetical protein
MAFKTGDWVRITPDTDLFWHQWTDVYDEFRNLVGEVTGIRDDPNEDGQILYKVNVFFEDKALFNQPANYYWLLFKERHLIRSKKVDAEFLKNMRKAGKELQEWESFKRKAVDDQLRDVFVGPSKKKTRKPSPKAIPLPPPDYEEDQDSNIWEEDTAPGIPLPGSAPIQQDIDFTLDDDQALLDDDMQHYFDNLFPDDYD